MINRNKFGFGTYEVLTVCVMLLIIVVVALAYVFRTDYKEKYSVMEYNARMFSLSSTNLYIEEGTRNVYYLQMLLDKKIFSEVKNPFQGKKYCDSYNSKVEFKDDKKYVTLECGNYLIYQQDTLAKSFAIVISSFFISYIIAPFPPIKYSFEPISSAIAFIESIGLPEAITTFVPF